MNTIIILNDPPYGTERSYNGLRLAKAIQKKNSDMNLTVFLMSDAVACAKKSQKLPQGYYNLELMLNAILRHKGKILLCGTCMDARGLSEKEMIEGCCRSTMDELSTLCIEADRQFVF